MFLLFQLQAGNKSVPVLCVQFCFFQYSPVTLKGLFKILKMSFSLQCEFLIFVDKIFLLYFPTARISLPFHKSISISFAVHFEIKCLFVHRKYFL